MEADLVPALSIISLGVWTWDMALELGHALCSKKNVCAVAGFL